MIEGYFVLKLIKQIADNPQTQHILPLSPQRKEKRKKAT